MNYLDLLPNDVMKIINRKVEDLRIISRRNERNKNREINIYYSNCHHYLPLLRGSPYESPFVCCRLKQPQKIPHAVKRRRRNL